MTLRLPLFALFLVLSVPAWAFVRTTTCTSLCHQVCPVDGACEDGGPGATAVSCAYGQDCADCGWRPDTSQFVVQPCAAELVDGERVFTEQPLPIFWPTCHVGYHVNDQGYSGLENFDAVIEVIQGAFATWRRVETAGWTGTVLGTTERQVPIINDQNLLTFVESDTCLENFEGDTLCGWNTRRGYAPGALALASVSYDPATGEIVDVDLEVNAANWEFGILCDGADGAKHDLQNTLTHEIGHFLGLDHCHDDALIGEESCATVTMRAQAELGDTSMRSLSLDDIAGVTELYPLLACDPPDLESDVPPAGDTAPGCGEVEPWVEPPIEPPGEDTPKGCRCSVGTSSGPGSAGFIALVLVVFGRRRERTVPTRACPG